MKQFAGRFAGQKTYIFAGLTIAGAVAAYLTGSEYNGQAVLSGAELAQFIVTAGLAVFIRHGIKTGK